MPAGIESALLDFGGLDGLARLNSSVHRLDPRAKTFTALALAVTAASFGKYDTGRLLPLLAYPVALSAAGGIPARFLFTRLLAASPFVLAVGLANPFLDREIMTTFGPLEISGGWVSFGSIVLRLGLTLSAALLLIATTGMDGVCMALRRMGAPRVFVAQLMLLYRYIFVLGGEAVRMTRAWSLRSFGARRMSPRVFAALTGQLLLRALDRAQRLHMAMLCRGFDGEIRRARTLAFAPADAVFVIGWCAFFAVARFWDLPGLMGRAAMGWFA